MPVVDFAMTQLEDFPLNVGVAPPTPVGGWNVRFQVLKRAGGTSGLVVLTCASGYGGGQSGITVTNSGHGQFQALIPSRMTSGLDAGSYYHDFTRLDSGSRTCIVQGTMLLLPQGGM